MAQAADTKKRGPDNAEVDAVRAFNRFYTKEIGLLGRGFMGTPFTLTQARVLWEIGHGDGLTDVAEIRRELDLDPGYLSRLLASFEEKGLVMRDRSERDRRRQVVRLTGSGRAAVRNFDRRASDELSELLEEHTEDEQHRLVEAMGVVRATLGDPARERKLTLRGPEPGDHGWILARHAAVYSREQGWGHKFEAYCGQVIVDFIARDDPERERCFIAELDGVRCGSIYCTRRTEEVAQVRLLLVEPWARGAGAGRRSRQRLRRLRAGGRLPPDHALHQQQPRQRPAHLRVDRLRVPRGAAGGHL